MGLSALFLVIGLLMLPCIANAQAHAPTATNPCPSGVSGSFKVYVLNFEPATAFAHPAGYASPTSSTSLTPGTAMYKDLQQAFTIAPAFFKQLLCGLDGVFINTVDCSFDYTNDICPGLTDKQITDASWGFREGPSLFPPNQQPSQYNKYIAMSAGPWQQAGIPAPNFSAYEQRILDQLLPWSSSASVQKPTYGPANTGADISAMTVLAALAHEFGHVLWYDTFRPVPGGPYDWSTFCHGTFFANSWRQVDAPPPWRSFGAIQNSHHPSAIAVQDIAIALLHQDFRSAGDLIQGINPVQGSNLQGIFATNGRWASMFAAFSPDEDFIETFKFYVLTKALDVDTSNNLHALNFLAIDVYGTNQVGYNIPDDYSKGKKSELIRKAHCIQEEFNSPTP
jgi:hypothetical protein